MLPEQQAAIREEVRKAIRDAYSSDGYLDLDEAADAAIEAHLKALEASDAADKDTEGTWIGPNLWLGPKRLDVNLSSSPEVAPPSTKDVAQVERELLLLLADWLGGDIGEWDVQIVPVRARRLADRLRALVPDPKEK